MIHQTTHDGGNELDAVHTFLTHRPVEAGGVEKEITVGQDKGATGTQGTHQVTGEHVERGVSRLEMHPDIGLQPVLLPPAPRTRKRGCGD